MSKFAYDTLGTSRELEAAGMECRQAEAVAIAIAQREGNLVTKSDLNSAIGRVESDISLLRIEVKSDNADIRLDMKAQFRWLISMQVVVTFESLRSSTRSSSNLFHRKLQQTSSSSCT